MRADGVIDSPWLRQCGQPRQHSPHGPHSPARVAGQPHPADADADGHGGGDGGGDPARDPAGPAASAPTRPLRTSARCTVDRDGTGSTPSRASVARNRCAPHPGCSRRSEQISATVESSSRRGLRWGRRDRSSRPASPCSR